MTFFKNKTKVLILILTIILVVLMAISTLPFKNAGVVSDAFGMVITPIQKMVVKVIDSTESFFKYFIDMKNLERKNNELKEEISNLNADLRDMSDLRNENERLRKLLELKERNTGYDYISCEVTSRNFNNWYCILNLDKGLDDGVGLNSVVVTNDGVVGYVYEAGKNWAKVTGIIDSSSSVAAICKRTKDKSVVQGDINLMQNGECLMPYIPKESSIVEGDEIYTSGDGGVYPEGLYIGKVERILSSSDGMTKELVIKTGVPIYDIGHVFVIKK
ncbi:MAG: rod shape-determining protein MreC [Ruminococcaceae bacterium]|nr:rod shape-determining protein MreC [Oscillospiraceae bacterium]